VTSLGKMRRLHRILPRQSALWLPVDDSLTVGPSGGLQDVGGLITQTKHELDALLAFRGTLRSHADSLLSTALIENLTASTVERDHTRKSLVTSVERALSRGADAIAAHLNLTAASQSEILQVIGNIADEAENLGIPLVVIAYPRRQGDDGADDNYESLKKQHFDQYVQLLCHTVRVAVELGADVVKTKYTGDVESFGRVIEASMNVPVVAAGGVYVDAEETITSAQSCLAAGARGLCFGRKVFSAPSPGPVVKTLRALTASGSGKQP
jgi:DhnA family fructose-bisphosphate aldolase class Ia